MDREFLEGLGLTDENIDLILEKSNSELSSERLLNSLKTEISNRGVKNIDAALKLFDFDSIKNSENPFDEISPKVDEFVLNNDFLFEANNHKPVFSANLDNRNDSVITKDDFNKMGYIERLKLFNENPEAYKQLTN